MKYRVIIDSKPVEGEPLRRIRADFQQFNEPAAERYMEFHKDGNPQLVPAGSEYEETAWDMLKRFDIDFRAVLVGDDCPMYCEDALKDRDMDKVNTFPRKTHIHGKHYRCTFSAKGRGHVGFDFWNSYADEEFNELGCPEYRRHLVHTPFKYGKDPGAGRKTVTPYDVLACITKSDPGTFDDFCSDFGYDTDSRRAEDTYRAVVAEWRKVQKFFTASELAEIQEVN